MSIDVERPTEAESIRLIGTIGLVAAIGVAVILGIHPPGDSDLYDDPLEFGEHVGAFWITIHVLAAVVTLAFPLVLATWGRMLDTARARVFGSLLAGTATLGTGLGVLHLVGTDTITIAFYEDSLGSPGSEVGADVFLRLHAATLITWIVGFWFAVQLVGAVAAWVDGKRGWRVYLPAAGAVLAAVSVVITISERQFTTLSEMVLFRTSVTIFIVWLALIGWTMRKHATA